MNVTRYSAIWGVDETRWSPSFIQECMVVVCIWLGRFYFFAQQYIRLTHDASVKRSKKRYEYPMWSPVWMIYTLESICIFVLGLLYILEQGSQLGFITPSISLVSYWGIYLLAPIAICETAGAWSYARLSYLLYNKSDPRHRETNKTLLGWKLYTAGLTGLTLALVLCMSLTVLAPAAFRIITASMVLAVQFYVLGGLTYITAMWDGLLKESLISTKKRDPYSPQIQKMENAHDKLFYFLQLPWLIHGLLGTFNYATILVRGWSSHVIFVQLALNTYMQIMFLRARLPRRQEK